MASIILTKVCSLILMMVDKEAMKGNYSKEDFIWMLENLFLENSVVDNWNSLSAQCVKVLLSMKLDIK